MQCKLSEACSSPCSSSDVPLPVLLLLLLLISLSTPPDSPYCMLHKLFQRVLWTRAFFYLLTYLLTYFLLITLRTQSCIYLLTRSLTCFGCMSLGTRATYISEVEGCSTGKSFRFVRTCVRAVWLPSRIGSPTLLVTLFSFLSRTH